MWSDTGNRCTAVGKRPRDGIASRRFERWRRLRPTRARTTELRLLAVLDANVLYPFQLRNLLLWLAVEGLYEPLWSELILGEVRRNLCAEAGLSVTQLEHLESQLRRAFPEACGSDFRGAEKDVGLPDEGDRHVLALAVHYEADVIVTWNTKHFPETVLSTFGLERTRPPTFLDWLWTADPDRVLKAAEAHRTSLVRDPLTPPAYLDALRIRAGLRRFAQRLEKAGFAESAPGR